MIIGIDPDTQRSGAAFKDEMSFEVKSLSFFKLFEYLEEHKEEIELVRIEAGWLNQKSNFHNHWKQKKEAGERIAKNIGSNHETGRKIAEMCEYLNVKYELVRPLGAKQIDHLAFKRITGYKGGRTNQDMRDAGMLVYNFNSSR